MPTAHRMLLTGPFNLFEKANAERDNSAADKQKNQKRITEYKSQHRTHNTEECSCAACDCRFHSRLTLCRKSGDAGGKCRNSGCCYRRGGKQKFLDFSHGFYPFLNYLSPFMLKWLGHYNIRNTCTPTTDGIVDTDILADILFGKL